MVKVGNRPRCWLHFPCEVSVEKFDGKENFGFVADGERYVVRPVLHKTLQGRLENMEDKKFEELDRKVASTIQIHWADKMMYYVMNEMIITRFWSRLRGIVHNKRSLQQVEEVIKWVMHAGRNMLVYMNVCNKIINEILVV